MAPNRPADLARSLASLPTACVLSLLPRAWRQAVHPGDDRALLPGAFVTAAVETAVGLFVLVDVTLLAGVHALEGLRHPSVLLGIAVGIEGAFRLSGAVSGTVVGSLPLGAVHALGFGARHGHQTLRTRRAAPDRLVRVDGGDLELDTAAPKGWHETTTVEIEGAFYRVVRESRWDDRARPHRYHLAPVPSGWLIRRLERWPPETDDPEADGGQSSTKV